jgi:hypothetical protein
MAHIGRKLLVGCYRAWSSALADLPDVRVVSNVIAFTRIYAAGRARWRTSAKGLPGEFGGAKVVSAGLWGRRRHFLT